MLAYLAKFYGISAQSAGSSGSDRAEASLHIDPRRAVELLEDILGLQEENFIAFRERARLLAAQPSTAAKREQPFPSERGLQRRPRHNSPESNPVRTP